MYTRSAQTRQVLVRATAELIAEGRVSDAGLVNICRRAGVSRGALYHHFASTTELTAAVYDQARSRVVALMEEAFEGPPTDAPERFFVALGAAMRTEKTVRAGMQLAADGTDGRPSLRDELLTLVNQRVAEAHEGAVVPSAEDLADLTVVVAAGIESLGHADPAWWEVKTSQRLWELLRPLFRTARERRA
ncbi:TetR/AcrR family transcriptional regulator [Streptomyces sp. Ru72]|uniref:TetR/AcrR family transcriptional regulator n=1 Tax=Streptomyces sp. Ru72 TaxID=2080747 RepID=UPI000CDD0C9A|nr:TetR/AcrR family transcriptional regulator [Streptomyces sp. Ru72]POX45966.1 TetR family transcriptional regulator [Streptomyces sp. Ru72]